MTIPILHRAFWDSTPGEVAECWTLKKGQRRAVCRMFSHQFAFELRLKVSHETLGVTSVPH
jgi:hypothetical protein